MNIVSVHDAIKRFVQSDSIVLWGASSSGLRVLSNLEFFFDRTDRKIFFYDSNPDKTGSSIRGIEVISGDRFLSIMSEPHSLCIVTSSVVDEISAELKSYSITNWVYSHDLIYTGKLFEKFGDDYIGKYLAIKNSTNLDADELYTLYQCSLILKDVPGDYAEVGVYRGGSACLVSHQMPDKKFYLFDTFEGLPSDGKHQLVNEPKAGWLSDTSADRAIALIKTSGITDQQLVVCKGYFPDDTASLVPEDANFCMVHLDTDRYQSTKSGLEFFYSKLSSGGRIIIHDYNCIGTPGVKTAVDEFVERFSLYTHCFSICESQMIIAKS